MGLADVPVSGEDVMNVVDSYPCLNISRRFSADYGDVLIVWSFLLNYGVDRPAHMVGAREFPDRTHVAANVLSDMLSDMRVFGHDAIVYQAAKSRLGGVTVDAIERLVYQERQRRRQVQGTV